jgi:Tfp pilus assembly protein PilN
MVQFNLLPDVKIEYIKTRNRKRLIILISAIASAVFFAIFLFLLLFVRVNQTRHISDLNKDIKSRTTTIQSTQDLDKILTIQNQLNSLPDLHNKKVVSSRIFGYLVQVKPANTTISGVDVDFQSNTMSIKGSSDSLPTINKFVDNLKFTDYKVNIEGGASGRAFKDVVLGSFGIPVGGQGGTVTYDIKFLFEPAIFQTVTGATDSKNAVTLTVPQMISTRSETEKPSGDIFKEQPTEQTEERN